MARGTKYSTQLVCPVCGLTGAANWEETENLLKRDLARSIISVSRGFWIDLGPDKSDDPKIRCSKCKFLVPI
jgi:hypothetical protein